MKKPWVIKAGGEAFQKGGVSLDRFLQNLARLARRQPVVFVHGGGPQLTEALQKRNSPARFVRGLRVTSPEEMRLVERVLSAEINKDIVGRLIAGGADAVGLSARDARLIQARPLPGMGRTGRPVRTHVRLLKLLLKHRFLPVVSPVSAGARGEAINVNADDAATHIARGLKASRLILLTNVPGVYGKDGVLLKDLYWREVSSLISRGVITGGMIPKVGAALLAVRGGVQEVVITSGEGGFTDLSGTRIHG